MAGDAGEALDAHQIIERIWVGSRPPIDRPLTGYSMLVLCAEEIQPTTLAFRGRVVRCPLDDCNPLPREHLVRALQAATQVVEEHKRGGRALITCAMGLNRSALVASLAILRLRRMSADAVVELVRQRRSSKALCNPAFVAIVDDLARLPATAVNRVRH